MSTTQPAVGRSIPRRRSRAQPVQFELQLRATYDPRLLRQLPAVLLHDSYFRIYAIQPWTLVRVRHGDRSADAWLVPMERRRLLPRQSTSWSTSGWPSAGLAKQLGMVAGETVSISVSTSLTIEQVQPVRIGNYVGSDTIVASPETRKAFGRRVILSSGSRVAVVSTTRRRSKKQDPYKVRMNFHLRRTLNIVPDASTGAEHVQISTYRRVHRRRSCWSRLWSLARSPLDLVLGSLELAGRLLLRAPRVTLACEESMTNDDSHGVARVSSGAAELLGITPGDSAYFYWGRNRIRLRVLILEDYRPHSKPAQSVVDWTPDFERPAADPESVVCIPGKARALLGVPRTGVVVARRSILSILRRRLIALALPFVAVGVGVAKLNLEPHVAGLLVGGALLLSLAGDRIPFRAWRR